MKTGIISTILFICFAFYVCCKKANTPTGSNNIPTLSDSTHISITINFKGKVQYYFMDGWGSLEGTAINSPAVIRLTYPTQIDSSLFTCTTIKTPDSVVFSAMVNSKIMVNINKQPNTFTFYYK